ncbi:unnamed protein product [Protopolystoma xenopodis]|uniref:Uncharacterized protein n=1 Tax=Protopolystoma xenopodis TaxID=117903 RepID=A0A3S5B0G4_9PLAT|nr:unnamed protein product [Protopolystoma xenopodis]
MFAHVVDVMLGRYADLFDKAWENTKMLVKEAGSNAAPLSWRTLALIPGSSRQFRFVLNQPESLPLSGQLEQDIILDPIIAANQPIDKAPEFRMNGKSVIINATNIATSSSNFPISPEYLEHSEQHCSSSVDSASYSTPFFLEQKALQPTSWTMGSTNHSAKSVKTKAMAARWVQLPRIAGETHFGLQFRLFLIDHQGIGPSGPESRWVNIPRKLLANDVIDYVMSASTFSGSLINFTVTLK